MSVQSVRLLDHSLVRFCIKLSCALVAVEFPSDMVLFGYAQFRQYPKLARDKNINFKK